MTMLSRIKSIFYFSAVAVCLLWLTAASTSLAQSQWQNKGSLAQITSPSVFNWNSCEYRLRIEVPELIPFQETPQPEKTVSILTPLSGPAFFSDTYTVFLAPVAIARDYFITGFLSALASNYPSSGPVARNPDGKSQEHDTKGKPVPKPKYFRPDNVLIGLNFSEGQLAVSLRECDFSVKKRCRETVLDRLEYISLEEKC